MDESLDGGDIYAHGQVYVVALTLRLSHTQHSLVRLFQQNLLHEHCEKRTLKTLRTNSTHFRNLDFTI